MDKAQQDALKKAAGIEAAKIVKNGMMVTLAPALQCASWLTSFTAEFRKKA